LAKRTQKQSAPAIDPAITDNGLNRNALEASERLRAAVKLSGGASATAARSGTPLRTLNHYLAGREMRRDGLVALADACGVSIEWLATGRGAMLSEAQHKLLSIRMYEPSEDNSRLARTPEYEQHLQQYQDSAPQTYPIQAQSQSQSQSGMNEHQESIARPAPIDVARLQQAVEIIKSLYGLANFDTPDVAERIASTYDVLTGAKS